MVTPNELINGYLPQSQGTVESAPQFSALNQGVLGANPSYGAMQGYLTAQNEMRAENKDNRDERTLNMAEEKFGWMRDQYQKEQTINAGMQEAAQDGGYEGVIAYLQKADPDRALKFQDAKLDLDNKIMNNDVMQSIKIPALRQQAFMESYANLGKMGAAILKAPPQDRDAVYQRFLPIAKVINPDMPDSLQEAAPTLLLAAAQATPSNELFKQNANIVKAQSSVGKTNADIKTLLDQGVSATDQTSDGDALRALYADRDASMAQADMARVRLNQAQVGLTKSQFDATNITSKNLAQASTQFTNFMDSYTGMQGALEAWRENPSNPQAQLAVSREFVKAYNNGAISQANAKSVDNSSAFESVKKKLTGLMTGSVVNADANEIGDMQQVVDDLKNQKLVYQQQIENGFQDSTKNFGKLVNWDNVVKPSDAYIKYAQNQVDQKTAAQGQLPASMNDWVVKAKQRGYSDDEINSKINSYLAQTKQAYQQQTQQEQRMTPTDYMAEQQ